MFSSLALWSARSVLIPLSQARVEVDTATDPQQAVRAVTEMSCSHCAVHPSRRNSGDSECGSGVSGHSFAHGPSEAKPAFLTVVASTCPSPGWVWSTWAWRSPCHLSCWGAPDGTPAAGGRTYKDRSHRTAWWQGDKWAWIWPGDWKVVTMNWEKKWRWRLGAKNSWCHLRVKDSRETTWSRAGELSVRQSWSEWEGGGTSGTWSGQVKERKPRTIVRKSEAWLQREIISRLEDCLLCIS